MGIVTRALFAQESSGNDDDVATTLDTFREAASSPTLLPEWTPLPRYQRIRKGRRAMDRIVYGMIDERAAESREALEARPDLLSTLILMADDRDSDAMTRQPLRDEVLTLSLAGHETTSQTLTWTGYLLSQNPDVEARLHPELLEVLGGWLPTADDKRPLADRILMVSMRFFPPVTTVPRVALEDVQMGEWSIPKGADVICWTYMAPHDPRWFEDPDRWLPKRAATITRGAYSPFGAGQRQCRGKHFALLDAPLILATLAQRYRLRRVPGHPVERQQAVTLSPKYGMRMTLEAH